MSDQTEKKKPRYPTNPDAPKFMPELWIKADTKTEKTPRGLALDSNCYQYAIAGSKPDGSNHVYDESVPEPGQLSGYAMTELSYTKKAIRNLSGLDGIRIVSADEDKLPLNKFGYYAVGIYVKNQRSNKNPKGELDYHFIRQDADGGWSEKQGYQNEALAQRFAEPAADGGYRPLPRLYGKNKNYKFVGYAYVPKEGIDAGLEGLIIPSVLAYKAFDQDVCSITSGIFDAYVGSKPETEHAASLKYVRELGKTIRKKGISEAADAYDVCLDDYVRNLKKPLNPSEMQIDAR